MNAEDRFLSAGGDAGTSPFRPPNDEEVFVTRETEKQRRKEQKEAAKHLKIWEKNTATSAAPLIRVKDTHIAPAEEAAGTSSYSKKSNTAINRAMHIARSRVQFPKEQRAQNINEFIDQKKEMFLAELACNTVDEEIKQLEIKLQRRDKTLLLSKKELGEDNNDLMLFIQNDNTMRE